VNILDVRALVYIVTRTVAFTFVSSKFEFTTVFIEITGFSLEALVNAVVC